MEKPIYRVRASSWGGLFDCAHRWEAENILGMRRASTMPAHLGTSIHEATAFYDQAIANGIDVSIDDAIDVFVDSLDDPHVELDKSDDLKINEARKRGIALVALYCQQVSPQVKFVSIEESLPSLEVDCGGVVIQITGTMDRARVMTGKMGDVVTDIKTGRRLFSSDGDVSIKGRSAQCGIYQVMYEQKTGIESAGSQILALSTGTKPQAGFSKVWDAKRVIIGTEQSPGMIDYAATMLKTGHFPPNPQSQLCSDKYCARWESCIYKDD